MAKTKQMDKYKQRNGYDYRRYVTKPEDIPGYFEKVTEPGQAVSIKTLYERYEKRRKQRHTSI